MPKEKEQRQTKASVVLHTECRIPTYKKCVRDSSYGDESRSRDTKGRNAFDIFIRFAECEFPRNGMSIERDKMSLNKLK